MLLQQDEIVKSKAVFDLNFSMLRLDDVVKLATENCKESKFPLRLLITPNVDHIVTLHNNHLYKKACQNAWLLTVDGFPVQKFLSCVDVHIPERVTGADLFPRLMAAMQPGKHCPCFVVATQQTHDFLAQWLLEKGFDRSDILIEVPPYGFENDEKYSKNLIARLQAVGCTHLYFGVGAPKSEIWSYSYREYLPNMYIFCFGAGIEFFSGNMKRAPEWMQHNGLEWLWRLSSEPKRLAKRYLINSWKFFFYAAKEFIRQKKQVNPDFETPSIIVDYSHMGRKVTGIERISEELFSPDALNGLNALHTKPASALGMIKAQWLDIPLLAWKYPKAKLLFPGFPPSLITSLLYRERVIPYIHDLFLLERPQELNIRAKLYMRPSFIYAIKRLSVFLVNSVSTENNLSKEIQAGAKIFKLRPFAKNVFNFVLKDREMPAKGQSLKILMLGTLEPRKNYIFAAQLSEKLASQLECPIELHISGRHGWGDVESKLQDFPSVKYHGYSSISELQELIEQSHLFMSTSMDEGLGLPLLEVLYSGIPIIASDIPVFREVTHNTNSVLISNTNLDEACNSIRLALSDGHLFEGAALSAKNAIEEWNIQARLDREVVFSKVLMQCK